MDQRSWTIKITSLRDPMCHFAATTFRYRPMQNGGKIMSQTVNFQLENRGLTMFNRCNFHQLVGFELFENDTCWVLHEMELVENPSQVGWRVEGARNWQKLTLKTWTRVCRSCQKRCACFWGFYGIVSSSTCYFWNIMSKLVNTFKWPWWTPI